MLVSIQTILINNYDTLSFTKQYRLQSHEIQLLRAILKALATYSKTLNNLNRVDLNPSANKTFTYSVKRTLVDWTKFKYVNSV